VRPVFETYGTPRVLGPLGSGSLVELINNCLFAVQPSAAYDAAHDDPVWSTAIFAGRQNVRSRPIAPPAPRITVNARAVQPGG
jgi:hypothetical protein